MARRRFTEKEKRNLVRKFERGGASATDFCRKHEISCQSLRRWRRGWKEKEGEAESTSFVELEVESGKLEGPRAEAEPAVELELGGGIILRIYRRQS
jgi:transposase-like protein